MKTKTRFSTAPLAALLLPTLTAAQGSQDLPTGNALRSDATPSFSWGDFDADGRVDLFVISPTGETRLMRNDGDGAFSDMTKIVGLAEVHGARFAIWEDFDADGRVDLFVGTERGPSRLFQNDGGAFVDATRERGVDHQGTDVAAAWRDFDGDGRLDLQVETTTGDVLYRNTEFGTFARVQLDLPPAFFGLESTGVSPETPEGTTETTAGQADTASVSGRRSAGQGRVPVTGLGSPTSLNVAPPTPVVGDYKAMSVGGGCAQSILDQTTLGCIEADSTPTLGRLLPLGPEFFVSGGGSVGINNLAPSTRLDVDGDFAATGDYSSSRPALENTGTGTLTMASHSGSGTPLTFDIREDSSANSNYDSYGMFSLTRTNMNADDAGNGLYFRMPTFFGTEHEYAGVGARIEEGLSGPSPASGSLRFYTSEGGTGRQNTLTVMPDGDLEQPTAASGLAKAACAINADLSASIAYQFNNLPGGATITIARVGPGTYEIDFGTDVSQRFFNITLAEVLPGSGFSGFVRVIPGDPTPNKITVFCSAASAEHIGVDYLDFFLTVF